RIAAVKPRVVATMPGPNWTIRKLIFEVEPGITIPALDISPGRYDRPGAAVVKVGVDWTHDLATEKAIDALLRSSSRGVLGNPRSMGETDPGADRGRAQETRAPRGPSFGHDVKEAFLSIHLARPLLGQRVVDVPTVLEGLKSELGGDTGFPVVGVGAAGPI